MMRHQNPIFVFVKILTLTVLLTSTSCSIGMGNSYKGVCNSRAYLQFVLGQYLSRRFPSKAPIRLGIIPFSAQANLAYQGSEFPGIGSQLSWDIQRELLRTGEIPIVEVFNRHDWPGKLEEFNTGNHGALALGRQAGFDLILVGVIERMRSVDQLTASTRLIEVASGTTVWFGSSTITNTMPEIIGKRPTINWGRTNDRPDKIYTWSMIPDLAGCIVTEMLSQEPVPLDDVSPVEEAFPEEKAIRRNAGDSLF